MSKLKTDPRNARKHPEPNKQQIRASLEEVGPFRSIAVDGDDIVRAGNGVFEQAQELGLKVRVIEAEPDELIAVKRSDLRGKQAERAALLDNYTGESSIWDEDVIGDILATDADLLAGLNDGDLGALIDSIAKSGEPQDAAPQVDKAEQLQEKWQVAEDEIWRLDDGHFVICGDCREPETWRRLLAAAGVESIGAVVTDSPYGIEREGILNDDPEGLRDLFDCTLAALPIKDAVIINFQSPRLFPVWLDAIRDAGHKFERMLWMYKSNDVTFPWRGWLLTSEAIVVSSVGNPEWIIIEPYAHDCYTSTGIGNELPKSWGKTHTSVKPLAVVSDLISRVGGIVADPFAGSGTSGVAAHNEGRRALLIEKLPKYVAVILQRYVDAFGVSPERINKV